MSAVRIPAMPDADSVLEPVATSSSSSSHHSTAPARVAATSAGLLVPAVCFLLVLPFTHTIAARLIFLALTGVCAILAWRRWGVPPIPGGLKAVWCTYSGWAVLSLLWSFAPAYSFGEIKDEIGYTLIAFLAFLVLVRSPRDFIILLAAMVGAFAVCTVLGLVKVANGLGWDADGIHGGSNNFSVWLVILAPMLVWLGVVIPRRGVRAGLVALAALFLAGAYYAEQRATWPVLGGEAVLLTALLLWRRPWPVSRKVMLIFSVVIVALLVTPIGVAKRMQVSYGEAVLSLKQTVLNDERTRDIWQVGRHVIGQRPLVGAGFGRIIAPRAYPEMNLYRAWHAHNVVLSRAVQLGWIGAILFVVLIAGMIGWLFQRYRSAEDKSTAVLAACALTTVTGLFFVNMTNDSLTRHTSLLFWSLMGMCLAMLIKRPRFKSEPLSAP